MEDLQERLLAPGTRPQPPRDRNRLTLAVQTRERIDQEEETWDHGHRMYHSIIEEPVYAWSENELRERSIILEEGAEGGVPDLAGAPDDEVVGLTRRASASEGPKAADSSPAPARNKKTLNFRIFTMQKQPQTLIYYFNLLFNIAFRIGLIFLLVVLALYGDGDTNENEQLIFVSVLLGLEFIIGLLYFLAITKILYTKSCDISVYFQKQFYQKPYSQINMERILRKHFTATKIVSNLCRLANPFTPFNKNIKVRVFKQEVYKRMELMMVFLPLMVVFMMGTPWFDRSNEVRPSINIQLLMGVVVCIEAVRAVFHYLFVYIFS